MISACTISTEGAPSLRFLQGWAEMLPAPFGLLCSGVIQPTCARIPGTHCVADASGIKSLGHPPSARNPHFPRASLKPGRRRWCAMYSIETRLLQKQFRCCRSDAPEPSTGCLSVVFEGSLRPALLFDLLRDEVLAFRAINVARHASRRTLLEDDQAFVVVAIDEKGRLVQRLQLIRLVLVGQL
jgi:hypothetical protein